VGASGGTSGGGSLTIAVWKPADIRLKYFKLLNTLYIININNKLIEISDSYCNIDPTSARCVHNWCHGAVVPAAVLKLVNCKRTMSE